jgi:hypothetical protein
MFVKLAGYGVRIDDEDYDKISKYKWYFNKPLYLRNGLYVFISNKYWYELNGTLKHYTVTLHRYIMNAKKGEEVDHILGNGLDLRKSQLRICTRKQNAKNRRLNSNNSSGFKGVNYNIRINKWIARIQIDGKRFHLGCFDTPEEAYEVYDKKAKVEFGEFYRPLREAATR